MLLGNPSPCSFTNLSRKIAVSFKPKKKFGIKNITKLFNTFNLMTGCITYYRLGGGEVWEIPLALPSGFPLGSGYIYHYIFLIPNIHYTNIIYNCLMLILNLLMHRLNYLMTMGLCNQWDYEFWTIEPKGLFPSMSKGPLFNRDP